MLEYIANGIAVGTKSNGYSVEGEVPDTLMSAIQEFLDTLISKEEVAARLAVDHASDEEAALFIESFPPWQHVLPDGGKYPVDKRVRDLDNEGVLRLYKCLQEHTPQPDWKPCLTPSLWLDLTHHEAPPGEYPVWKKPQNAEEAYHIGDIVWYNDTLMICTQGDASGTNSWPPNEYGWEVYTP